MSTTWISLDTATAEVLGSRSLVRPDFHRSSEKLIMARFVVCLQEDDVMEFSRAEKRRIQRRTSSE